MALRRREMAPQQPPAPTNHPNEDRNFQRQSTFGPFDKEIKGSGKINEWSNPEGEGRTARWSFLATLRSVFSAVRAHGEDAESYTFQGQNDVSVTYRDGKKGPVDHRGFYAHTRLHANADGALFESTRNITDPNDPSVSGERKRAVFAGDVSATLSVNSSHDSIRFGSGADAEIHVPKVLKMTMRT